MTAQLQQAAAADVPTPTAIARSSYQTMKRSTGGANSPRRTPDGPVRARDVNYFQLYWDGARWWIAGMVWDEERPNNRIPPEWIGRWTGR